MWPCGPARRSYLADDLSLKDCSTHRYIRWFNEVAVVGYPALVVRDFYVVAAYVIVGSLCDKASGRSFYWCADTGGGLLIGVDATLAVASFCGRYWHSSMVYKFPYPKFLNKNNT